MSSYRKKDEWSDEAKGGCALAVVLVLFLGVMSVVGDWTYSEGVRVGTLSKFSRKGVLFKTHEGELVLGGFVTTSDGGSAANVWAFSLERDSKDEAALAAKIGALADAGAKVRLTYRQIVFTWPWKSKTDYLVVAAEPCAASEKAR